MFTLEFPASKLVNIILKTFVWLKKIAFRNVRAPALKLKVNCDFQPTRPHLSDLIIQWIA